MRNGVRLFLLCLASFVFAGNFLTSSSAQQRLKAFSHNTAAHRTGEYKDCSSCHTLPSKNWESPIKYNRKGDGAFPDVVDFPYKKHATCNNCHAGNQVPPSLRTNGNNFAFCGSCHVKLQGGEAGMRRFPDFGHPRQFDVYFPHDVHQDIIASNEKKAYAAAHFVSASYSPIDTKAQANSCAICHTKLEKFTPTAKPAYDARTLPASLTPLPAAEKDVFDTSLLDPDPKLAAAGKLAASNFKDMPDNHASCFQCHYQGLKPEATDCAGCHKLADKPYFESDTIVRYSLKFNHERKDHATKDCTSCHVRITQNSDTRLMKDADVPISACVSCHRTQITDETGKRDASAKDKSVFQCNYCHTTAIGRYPTPSSHLF